MPIRVRRSSMSGLVSDGLAEHLDRCACVGASKVAVDLEEGGLAQPHSARMMTQLSSL